jgi:hypothetical protein
MENKSPKPSTSTGPGVSTTLEVQGVSTHHIFLLMSIVRTHQGLQTRMKITGPGSYFRIHHHEPVVIHEVWNQVVTAGMSPTWIADPRWAK